MVVLVRNLFYLSTFGILTRGNDIDIGRMTHACTGSENLVAIICQSYATIISPVVGDLFNFALEVGLIEVQGSVPNTYESKALVVLVPYESFYVGVKLV